jgi:hypothetical protein
MVCESDNVGVDIQEVIWRSEAVNPRGLRLIVLYNYEYKSTYQSLVTIE